MIYVLIYSMVYDDLFWFILIYVIYGMIYVDL